MSRNQDGRGWTLAMDYHDSVSNCCIVCRASCIVLYHEKHTCIIQSYGLSSLLCRYLTSSHPMRFSVHDYNECKRALDVGVVATIAEYLSSSTNIQSVEHRAQSRGVGGRSTDVTVQETCPPELRAASGDSGARACDRWRATRPGVASCRGLLVLPHQNHPY